MPRPEKHAEPRTIVEHLWKQFSYTVEIRVVGALVSLPYASASHMFKL
jgi:hypothetical protein